MTLSANEREILKRLEKGPMPWPMTSVLPDWSDYRDLEQKGLIQWTKAPHSSVEWEITEDGQKAVSSA